VARKHGKKTWRANTAKIQRREWRTCAVLDAHVLDVLPELPAIPEKRPLVFGML
jgi:hypothetical protein